MLTDEQLIARLKTLCRVAHRVDARVIEHLVQVEERRLALRMAHGSLWDFCRHELGMSEGSTQRRVEAVRAVQKVPRLLGHLASGRLSLSGLALVRDHLTEENADDLVARIERKSRSEIEEVIVSLAPRPDVPSLLRRLPTPAPAEGAPGAPPPPPPPPPPPRVERPLEALSPQRWKLQLTADQALHDQLERAKALMRHRNPTGDLAVVVAAAVDLLVEKLERERLATVKRPVAMRAPTSASERAAAAGERVVGANTRRAIPREVRRAVFARDGVRCTYVDARGERCRASTWLELDHIQAHARGGADDIENLRVRCRAHNRLHAEVGFGRDFIAHRIQERKNAATKTKEDEPPAML